MGKCISCSYASFGLKGIPLSVGIQIARRRQSQVKEWISVSEAVARVGMLHGGDDLRGLTVIPCLLPDAVLGFNRDAPRPEFVPAIGPYLMYAGGLSKPKGVDTLLEAHQILWSSGVQIPLVIAGLPSPGEEFNFALPGVMIASNVDHDSVMAAWVNATAGVVPSAWGDPCPQVAIECIAAGTPLVVTSMGGLPEIVDGGKYGLVVEPNEPEELAGAIRRILDDSELRDRLSSTGPERAQRYSASVVLKEVDQCYRRVIQTARPSSAP
jgi:glycosyltransferase involved in cell wall biosynthesis